MLVYDRLAHPKVLEHAKRSAELIYVGKTPDHHTMKQDEINRLLVDLALAGKKVARVKGGDPFVFGRGGEEAEALAKAGVEFDVVPGVSSAIGVPAYAGIPVTHRGVATSLGIVTGHEDPVTGVEGSVDWDAVARGGEVAWRFRETDGIDLLAEDWFARAADPLTEVQAEYGFTGPGAKSLEAKVAGSAGPFQPGGIGIGGGPWNWVLIGGLAIGGFFLAKKAKLI